MTALLLESGFYLYSSRSSVAERPVGEWGRVGEVHWKVLLCQLLRHHLCRGKFTAVQDIGVDVRGHRDRTVAEEGGDYLEVDSGGEHQSCIRVTKRMQRDVRFTRAFFDRYYSQPLHRSPGQHQSRGCQEGLSTAGQGMTELLRQ